jgi:hypothetical protein
MHKTKAIHLHRETLRSLTSSNLDRAIGGATLGIVCTATCVDTTCAANCTFRCPSRIVVCP